MDDKAIDKHYGISGILNYILEGLESSGKESIIEGEIRIKEKVIAKIIEMETFNYQIICFNVI